MAASHLNLGTYLSGGREASAQIAHQVAVPQGSLIDFPPLSSKALTPLCSCLASITSSLAFLSASFLFFLSSCANNKWTIDQ